MTTLTNQQFPDLLTEKRPAVDTATAAHCASLSPKTRTPILPKVKFQHPSRQEKNKLATQHAADMKANRGLRKICADKAFLMDGARLFFLVAAIGAQGVVKATTGMELWSDPVLIAITSSLTVNALSGFLRVIHSLFPLSRSADQQDVKKTSTRKK